MAKKNLSDKVFERVQQKRENPSNYSAASTDKDASVAERALQLVELRREEREARAAATAAEPARQRATYSRPPLASETPSVGSMERDEAMSMLLGDNARDPFGYRGSIAGEQMSKRIEQAARSAAEGSVAGKKNKQPTLPALPIRGNGTPWTDEQLATIREAVEKATFPTREIEREFAGSDPEARAAVEQKYEAILTEMRTRKPAEEMLPPEVLEWKLEQIDKKKKKNEATSGVDQYVLSAEGITQAEAELIQNQYDEAHKTFWQKAKDAVSEDLENLYDFTIGQTTGRYLHQLRAEDEANDAQGASIGELGQALLYRTGGNFNDFLLGIAENYNDATNELMNLLGVKADHNYFSGLRRKNAETMAAGTAAADENATWAQRMLLDTASSAANSYIMAYMGRGLGAAANNLAGGGNHAVNPLLRQNRIANAVTAAQMAPFAVQSANEAYDAAEAQGLSGWQKGASAITAMFMSYASNSSAYDDYMERVGLGVAGNAEMMARNAAARSMSMSERAFAWLTDTLMGMSTGEGVQEVVESLTLKLNNDMWAGTFFDAEGWNNWSQQARQDFVSGYMSGAVFNAATLPSYFASNRMYKQMMNGELETTPENIAELIVQVARDSQTPEGQAALQQASEEATAETEMEQLAGAAAREVANAGMEPVQRTAPAFNITRPQQDAQLEEQIGAAARQAAEVRQREENTAANVPAVSAPNPYARPATGVQNPYARPNTSGSSESLPAQPDRLTTTPQRTQEAEKTGGGSSAPAERAQPAKSERIDYHDRSKAKKIEGRSFMSEIRGVYFERLRGGRELTITDAYREQNGSLFLVGVNKKGNTVRAGHSLMHEGQSRTEKLLNKIATHAKAIGYGDNSAVEINEAIKNYDSSLGSMEEYAKDFNFVYKNAKIGMTADEIRAESMYGGCLSDKAFEAAFNLGAENAPKIEYKTKDQKRAEAAEVYKASGQKPEGAIDVAKTSPIFAGDVTMNGAKSEKLTPVALSVNAEGERVVTAIDSDGKLHTETLAKTMFENETAQRLLNKFWVDTFDIDQQRGNNGMASRLTDEALAAYIDGYDESRVSGETVEDKVAEYAKEFYRAYKAGERGLTLEEMVDGDEKALAKIHKTLSDEIIERAYNAGSNTPQAKSARRIAEVTKQKAAEARAKAGVTVQAKPETKPEVKPETKAEAKPEAKPEAKSEAKPEAKPETKPETKPEAKPEAKAESMTETKAPAEGKPAKPAKKTQMFHAEQSATYTDENGDQHDLEVLGVESIEDGMPVLQVRDEKGEIDYYPASDLDIEGNYGELMAYEGVARMDAKALRNYLEGYNPDIATPKQYARAYNAVYQRGVSGLDFEQAYNRSNMAREHMSKAAATDAYAAGLNVYNTNHESVQAAEVRNDAGAHVAAGNASLSAQEGRKGGKISKRYTQAAFANMSKEGRNNAIAQMEMLSALASRTGRTIVVEDSIVGPNGTQANAYYDPKTGEIHIALDTVGGAYTYAAMHELTHAIKAEHQQEWGGFVDFVKGALDKNGMNFDQLVQYQQNRFGYDRALAEEEVICNTVPALLQDDRNVLELYRGNRTLFERVVDWVRGLLQDIKTAGDALSKRSTSWAQMDALKNDRQTLQEMYDRMMAILEKGPELRADDQVAEFERNMVEGVTASVTEAPVGENGEPIRYSLTTYNETLPKPISVGRAKAMGLEYEVQKLGAKGKRTVAASGRDVTEALMRKEGFDDKTIKKVLKYADRISKWFEKAVGRYEFVNLQDVNDASIMIDHNTGEIKFSCQVPNSEYKVNFDFTTVCRQREAVQRFIDDLARERGENGTKLEDIQLTPQNIFKLNTILKNEGYETACLGCFVEAKRYRIKQQAETLCEEWNALVLAQNPDADYFGFATGDTDLMKMSNDEVTKLEASMRAYNTKGTSKAVDRAARLVQLPEMQHLIRPSDFISRQGRQKIREFSPALESFLASRFGQGGAKPAVGFMPYNSEVAALPDTKSVGGKRMTLQQYLKNLGGGRSNSFSDYIPTHALDYLQRTIDMAARKLPAQCYTKVAGRARTFGMTGEKINMSVMFDIDPDVHWSSAGLGKDGEYLVGDKARADKIEKETGERPFTQSFPWEEAVAIEHDPRYAENCGIIGVGYSYKHIVKMMADGNIPYIIAYHRSAMPDSVAKASNTKHATNYEPVQNNTRVTGYAVVTNLQEGDGVPSYATWPEGKKKTKASDLTWDMQAALKRHGGDARAAIAEWHAWMEKNNLTPVTSTAEAGHGKFDVYASLNRTMDPAKTANEYMAHCIENGMLPVFYEFATFENYDKHLFDFSVRNLATGTVAPQKNVSFDFMDSVSEDDFMAMMDADMAEYNDYNREQFYSEKWGRVKDTAYEELKFSLRDTDENVQDALSAEQKAFELVKGHRINAAEADKIAGEVLKQANSDYDRQKLAAEISRIYDYVERGVDVDWAQVDDETTSLMAKVMESSKSINLEHEEMAKPIRDYLRKTSIRLTEAQRKEAENMSGTYGGYRKQLFGKVRLTSVGGTPLDSLWAELTAMNSELFPADANEGEQAALLVAAVDALKPVYENNTGMNVEESASWLAGKMNEAYFSLPAVKASAKSGKTFGDSVANLKEAMKRFEATSWSEYQNALRKIREARGNEARTKKQEEVAALRQKYVDWRTKDSAKRKERELVAKYRAKVERSAKTLANWIDKPTDAKHIPQNVEKSVREMLGALDFSGKGTKTATDLANHLSSLADSLKEAQEGEDENRTMFLERDQQMIDEIKRLSEIIMGNAVHDARSGRGVYDLNGLELKELSKWLDVIKHVVTKAGQMRGSNLPGNTVEEVAAASMFEIGRKKAYKDRNKISKALGQVYGPDMQDSFSFFERLGPTTNAVFKELRQGFDKMAGLVGEAEERTKKILDGLNLKKISGQKAKKHKFQLQSGEVELTTGQIMELYVLSKRQQAQGHLYGGGFRVQGDENARPYTIDEEELARITATLKPEERNAADGMQAFLSKECAAWGNKTSVELLGYKKFGEEFYWPISTDPNQRNTTKLEDNFGANISAIKNQGMTKALTEGASNALVIGDIFDTYTRHISNMAAYSAYALPLSDFTRWYNARGVKTEIEHALGKNGIDYINQFLMALNGSAQQEQKSGLAKFTTTMTRNAKIAAVGSNVRVVVQQPTSYARAAMYMSPKYLSGALTMKKPDENLVNKYCAIARWKRWGFYETNVGPNLRRLIVGDAPAVDVVREKMTAPAAAGDNWTLNHLWNACELETRAVYPELKKGSEEYYTQVGNRMSEIIDRTQVVDSVFHRSQMMRSKNWINQSLTNFMAEPTKSYNMLMGAINDYAENRKNKAARNRVARAFGVYAMTGVLTAAAAGLVDAFRDTDEEKTWVEKYLNALKENTFDNLNPIGMLPGAKDILSLLQGFESSRLDQQGIQRLIYTAQEWKKWVNGESKMNAYGMTYKTMQALSSLSGIPVSNIMRDANAVWQTVTGRSPTLNAEGRKNATADLLYGAIVKGEKAKAAKYREELLTQAGMSPKDVETAIARKLAEDPRVIEAYNAKMMRDFKTANRLINELTAQGFDREAVDKAITLQEPKEPVEKDPDAKLKVKLYKADDVADAIRVLAGMASGNATEMDVKTMMFELAVDSSSQSDINVQIRNDIANVLKPDYLAMAAAGDTEGMSRLESLLANLFEYEGYDIVTKMHGWVKTQHSDALKKSVQDNDLQAAKSAVVVMRRDGKTDSEIKSSLSSYKQIYIDAVRAGDNEAAMQIKRMLMGLGLKGKNGKALYTNQTFIDWLQN